MKMEMHDGLTGILSAIIDQTITFIRNALELSDLFGGTRHGSQNGTKFAGICFSEFTEIGKVFSGKDKHVNRGHRVNIANGNDELITVNKF